MSDDCDPDHERVQEGAADRQHARTEHVEAALADTPGLLSAETYPTTTEELATEYADTEVDLPNETESLGSVIDRLPEDRLESPDEARAAIEGELGGGGDPQESSDGRALGDRDDPGGSP